MASREEILAGLARLKEELAEEYAIRELGLFGSFVRAEGTDDSDVDVLVEFSRPIGMFKFLELEERLARALGHKVDLVSKKALKQHIGARILAEVVNV